MDLIVNNNSTTDRLDCKLCDIHDIHKNDYENHIQSRKHKYKEKKAKLEIEPIENVTFRCEYCKVTLTDEEFYNIHRASKAHRRKLRKLGLRDTGDGGKPTSEIDHGALFPVTSRSSRRKRGRSLITRGLSLQQPFNREKYKIRNIANIESDYYKTYITSVTAYLSLRLALDHTIQDFSISVNDKDWHSFGDIVIKIFQKDKKILYAIKCKQISNTFKQIKCLNDAKVIMEREYICVEKLKKNDDFDIGNFAIFTTHNTTSNFIKSSTNSLKISPKTLNKWKTGGEDFTSSVNVTVQPLRKENTLINVTSDRENVFSFLLPAEVKNVSMPVILVFTNQHVFPHLLNELLKRKFNSYPDITKDFSRYIDDWIDGNLGGNYKLRKKDIILTLGQILLHKYIIDPKIITIKQDNFEAWNDVISMVDLTIVKKEPFIMSKICQPFNKIIEETFSTKIDTISKTITLKNKINESTEPELKAYLFEQVNDLNDDIHLSKIYRVLWKCGKIPLLMSSEHEEDAKLYIQDVIEFMKQYGVHRKFLLKTDEPHVIKSKEKISTFSCLEDVKDIVDLNKIHIQITDTFKLSLHTISSTDPFFLKWITPTVFFDMTLEKYSMRPNLIKNASYDSDLKIILSEELRDVLYFHLYGRSGSTSSLSSTEKTKLMTIVPNQNVGRLKGVNPLLL